MHKKLSLGLWLGLIGNLLFVLFALLWVWFYNIYEPDNGFVKFLEKMTYLSLYSGFICLAAAEVLLWRTMRMRLSLKIGFALYIAMEAFMMYCELHSYDVMSFYEPYSLKLAIAHSILSGVVCFLFVYLDPYKTPYEIMIILCIGLIFGGMFGNLIGIRVYFSILVNAIAFSILFAGIRIMIKREIIEIDCYGDRARVAEYRSVFFEEDDDSDEEENAPAEEASETEAKAEEATEPENVPEEAPAPEEPEQEKAAEPEEPAEESETAKPAERTPAEKSSGNKKRRKKRDNPKQN